MHRVQFLLQWRLTFRRTWPLPMSLLLLALAAGSHAVSARTGNQARPAAKPCSPARMSEILDAAHPGHAAVHVDCSMTLEPGRTVTKQLIFQGARASGARLICRGGTIGTNERPFRNRFAIVIKSQQRKDDANHPSRWARPEDISIEGCEIFGAIHVFGMARNGEGLYLRDSSHAKGHTQRAQRAAPTDIKLRHVTVRTNGLIALYVGPGTTRVLLENSKLRGTSRSVGVYLDAESAHNTIRRNLIAVDAQREQIAVDGSADNLIVGNRFAELDRGGVYLYRNCGEGGTVRHQAPVRNKIADNTFYYRKYRGPNPAIWIASRNGQRNYCSKDAGYPFGSSVNDHDLARQNIVTGNRIVGRRPEDVIRVDDQPNRIEGNQTVAEP